MNEYQELIAQAKEELNMEAVQEYAALKRRQKELQAEMKDVAPKAFRLEAQRLFDEHEALDSFGWNQYTPYYCDGEPCNFSSYHTEPEINDYYDGDCPSKEDLFYGPAKHKEIAAAVKKFLSSYSEEEVREIFGDHVSVKVTKSGITTERYDHE